MNNKNYRFDISLNVLNHLGRKLYRNFITVLGEAISNSWDADAKNIWIEIDKDTQSFIVKDDGLGMNDEDFQGKFLKIGYSKRKQGDELNLRSPGDRPYIGAKGIGKLALLSCADTISIISKTASTSYVNGVIDNSDLTEVIEREDEYELGGVDWGLFEGHTEGHNSGTIIHFKNINQGIKNTIPNLRKLIALYFRFSLIDDDFNIHLNGEKITTNDLKELSEKTEFLWKIGDFHDPFIDSCGLTEGALVNVNSNLIKGFVATVAVPRNLKITGTDEKVGVDLLVNGRLRERDLLKHISTARIAESYMYGQIHFDALDADGEDRFTSSREGVIESDDKYQSLLSELRKTIIPQILDKWDKLRLSKGRRGDDENKRKTQEERDAHSLFHSSVRKFEGKLTAKSNQWVEELEGYAEFNIPAYADCFLSENLLRKYLVDTQVDFEQRDDVKEKIRARKGSERSTKKAGNINIDIRQYNNDLEYLDMGDLTDLVENPPGGSQNTTSNTAVTDGKEYRPIRNAVAHTALLTEQAKLKLRTVYNNIRGRVNTLVVKKDNPPATKTELLF